MSSLPVAHWVHAHPQADSFNSRLFRAGVDALSRDYEVVTSDLYRQGFDPVLAARDLGDPLGRSGNVVELMGEAYAAGRLPDDVVEEQRKLGAADLIVLQFPLWWYGPPAILKGWFDRVLTNGFAYGPNDPETGLPLRYGEGLLAGRRALVIVTAGEDDRSIGTRGISGDIDQLLFPLTHGTLWYTGIEPLDLHVVHDADGLDADGVERETARLRARLDGVAGEVPSRPYRRLKDGDYRGTRGLRADLLPGRTDLDIHRIGRGSGLRPAMRRWVSRAGCRAFSRSLVREEISRSGGGIGWVFSSRTRVLLPSARAGLRGSCDLFQYFGFRPVDLGILGVGMSVVRCSLGI